MRIVGTQPNKFEIFQEFYYITNGVQLSYKRAVELFYQMDKTTHNEFCKYYADKTDYQLIYKKDASGNIILDDNGNEIIINVPYTSANGYGLDKHVKASDITVAKNSDGTDKTRTEKGCYLAADGSKAKGSHDVKVYEQVLSDLNQAYIGMKYTIEAYAVKNGLNLDPVWSQYSPEEIIQMENEGVNIPQEILDIAHTILEGSGENYEGGEDEEGAGEKTTERESFLELIPKAEKHIEKLNDNKEKIDDKIDDLLAENQSNQKSLFSKQKEQLDELKEYEEKIREWRHLQDKINNGEELTDSEARKYAQITGMLQDKNTNSKDFGLDKNKIAFSLNEINILAVLGEKLADETIEIGDELTDYISQDNYKRTRDMVMGEVGILRGIVAMANGKSLAKEASIVGNEAKEYTEETTSTINDIAGVLDVKQMIANPGAADAVDTKEPIEVKQAEDETATEGTEKETPAPTADETEVQKESAQEENNTEKEDFIINDENVLSLIKEVGDINIDLLKEIKTALEALKLAKDDKKFADRANKVTDKLIEEYQKEEEERQRQIAQKEQENKEAQERIDELQGENSQDNKEIAKQYGVKTDEEDNNDNNQKEIEEKQSIIEQNNNDIEALKAESEGALEEFKQKVQVGKNILAEAIPEEQANLERETEYKDEIIPEDIEKLDFTNNSGGTLYKMGKYRITVGLEYLAAGWFCPPLRILGMYHIAKGSISAGIGATAKFVSKIPTPKVASKVTDSAVDNEENAIKSLNEADAKISAITGEQTETEKLEAAKENEENGENEGIEDVNEADATDEATGENSEKVTGTEINVSQMSTMITASGETIVTDPKTGAPADPEDGKPIDETEETPVDKVEEKTEDVEDTDDAQKVKETSEEAEEEGAESTTETSSSSKSKKKEKDQDPDKAEEAVKDANGTGKELGKDSEKVQKDTEKDTKKLEKEAKNIEKLMKADEKEIIRMTKESLRAAKKQQELLSRYEALVAENDQIAAEEESKQNSAPAAVAQPQQAQEQAGQQAGAMAVAGGATVTDSSQGSTAENQAKMEANNQEITVISGQFKVYGNKIERNRTKILKKQKTNKARNKRLDAKIKIKDKKVKEAQKKELEKQQRLAKQLAIVGIQENIFQIVQTTGQIMMMVVVPPWVAAVGEVLNAIGMYGILACGVAKAIINLANGNAMGALMALGQAVISFVASKAGGSSGCSNVMSAVSSGLSIVSSSAELVNNVRTVQGKEASGTFSKIGTIAGVASAVTGAASSLGNMKGQNTFGKVTTVASVAGTAMSSASQLMNEFGWGSEDTRNMLGTIGTAVSTAASIAQLMNTKKDNLDDKNKDAKEKTDNADNKENQNDKKTKEQKKAEKAEKKEQKKAEKEQAKADKKAQKETKKEMKAEKKEQKKAEKEQKKANKDKKNTDKKDGEGSTQPVSPVANASSNNATPANTQTANQNQPTPDQAVAAAAQANANEGKMNELKNDNNQNTTVVNENNDNNNQNKGNNKKDQLIADDKTKTNLTANDDANVNMDLKEIDGVKVSPEAKLDDANIEASMNDLKSKVDADIAKNNETKPLSKQEQEKQDIELAKKEREQKQNDAKELTKDDIAKTDENGNKMDVTNDELAKARANITERGASKEFATMDDKTLANEITSLDAELKSAPADQNNNGNQNQEGQGSTTSGSSDDNTQNQTKTEKQQKLDKLKKEQENRKAYQERQDKLKKHEKNEKMEHAGNAIGKLFEGITQGAQLFASNQTEEPKKKGVYGPARFTDRTKRIMAAHANMVSSTTSIQDQEEFLKKLKKQPRKLNVLAGRYMA